MELLVDQLRSTDKEARRKVIRELESYGKEAVKPLIQALKDGDNKVRQRAASALGRIGDRRAVEPLILALHDSDMFTRVFAADALGKIGDERAVEPLIQALKDKLVSVRYSAADALGKIGDERAVEPLIQALEWGSAQMDIINALGRLGDARAVEPLIEVLRYGGDYVPRVCAAAALGEIGDERAIEPLTEALNDEEKDVRQAAKYALTRIMKERGFSKLDVQLMLERSLEDFREGGVEFLTKALSSGDLLVRLKAVRVLGEMRDEGAVEPLVRALSSHSHCYIRFRAHEALVRMGEVAVEPLIKALEGKVRVGVAVQIEVAEILAEIGDERAIEPIIQVLKDSFMDVKFELLKVLAEFGEPALESAIEAHRDSDSMTQEKVGGMVKKLRGEKIFQKE